MEDFDYSPYEINGRLATSDTTFHVQLAPLDGLLSFPDRGLQIRFNYHFFAAPIDGSGHSISRYELYLAGTIAERHEDALTWYLERAGVPLTAIIAVNDLIFDTYGPGDMEALARIDLYGYEPTNSEDMEDEFTLYYNDELDLEDEFTLDYNGELDRVVEMSEAEYGRPTPASRDAVEALEKVVIRSETNCGVCLEGFVFGSVATKMPCSHAFHGDCIVRWLEISCFCPLCRFMLLSDS